MSVIKYIVLILVMVGLVAAQCGSQQIEREQQERNQLSLIQNQPIPNLGGYSFERDVVIQTYLARNRTIATYTYTMTEIEAKIIEICASIGYPIPYATQLTNPLQYVSSGGTIGNPEPNGLYSPATAEGTIINCANEDGTITPTYWEPRVFALPYRIKSDMQLQRIEGVTSTFSIELK
jgi:hypothetical protein